MYAKTAKYGERVEDKKGSVVGAINFSVLPQGHLNHDVEISVKESNDLGKYAEPMIFISIDNKPATMLTLQSVLKCIGVLEPKPINALGQFMIEPEVLDRQSEEGC